MRSQFIEIELVPARARNQDLSEFVARLGGMVLDLCNAENAENGSPAQAVIVRNVTRETIPACTSKFTAGPIGG